jgi:hypothetical protein
MKLGITKGVLKALNEWDVFLEYAVCIFWQSGNFGCLEIKSGVLCLEIKIMLEFLTEWKFSILRNQVRVKFWQSWILNA